METGRRHECSETRNSPVSQESVRDAARYMLRVRKAAKAYFGKAGHSEAAWSLLLTLQSVKDGTRGCHVGLAAKNADVPHTTAVRSLRTLHRHGFVSLRQDPSDRRATLVRMTANAEDALRRAFSDALAS